MEELDVAHESYNQALYESNMAEAEIEKELESSDVYKTQFSTAKMKVRSLNSTMSVNMSGVSANFAPKVMKLPGIKLPQFHGKMK